MNLQEQSILGNGGKMYVLLVELRKGKRKLQTNWQQVNALQSL